VEPDTMSLYTTRSVSWLAQFACHIVTAMRREHEFRCEGVENLGDFKALIESINSVDPASYTFRSPVDPPSESNVHEFGRRMDAVLDLLSSTIDAMAAERLLRADDVDAGAQGGGFKPTIH